MGNGEIYLGGGYGRMVVAARMEADGVVRRTVHMRGDCSSVDLGEYIEDPANGTWAEVELIFYGVDGEECGRRRYLTQETEPLSDYLTRQWEWSRRTFGEGYRLSQLRKHIDSELLEIGANPGDPVEWLDLALLALDGAQRFAGLTPDQVMPMLIAKQQKNFARTWPTPVSEDEAVEHDRSGE